MTQTVRAAVIGIGEMGWSHLRVYKTMPSVSVVGVADINKQALERAKREYNVPAYEDVEELLSRKKPGLVSIVVPTALHSRAALAAMRRGVHVLVEKPIAIDENEAEEMIAAAKKHNVKLMVGHIERFNPAVRELKKRLEANELGDIYKIDVERIGPFPQRVVDTGVINDLSVHDLDIIRFLTGAVPIRMYAETQQKIHGTHEDSVVALVRYPNDLIAVLNINFLSPQKIRRISIFGQKGMFRADYLHQTLDFYRNPSYSEQAAKNRNSWQISEGKAKAVSIQKKEPLLAELEAFVAAVRGLIRVPVTGEDGLTVLRLANLLKQSADSVSIKRGSGENAG